MTGYFKMYICSVFMSTQKHLFCCYCLEALKVSHKRKAEDI